MRLLNFLSSGGRAKRLRSVVLLAVLAACCARVRANEIMDRIADGTIVIQGGTYVADGDDVVITYTATTASDTTPRVLNIKAGQATARVLAIGGGGGGGGTLNKSSGQWGAGGGGGAGGMVDVPGLTFKGQYDISVGAGGSGVASNTHGEGGDGGNTTIQKDETQVAGIPVAIGGGGGGAGGSKGSTATTVTTTYTGKGRSGGSGGGGSQTYKGTSSGFAKAGGSGTSGQGNAGGSAKVNNKSHWIGAGGGGAGGAGTDVLTSKQTGGAPGGAGKASDITGSDVVYASGGAGGALKMSTVGVVAAKEGGGGSGGTDDNTASRDGAPSTGGGGGGAGNTQPSGAGGSGVLIVRLSGYMAGGVTIPTIEKFVYDGTPKTATVETRYYTVAGVIGGVTETAAGNYQLRLTLTAAGEAVGWDDPTDPRISGNTCDIEWSIAQKPIAAPTTVETSYTYTGDEQTGYTNGVWYTVAGDAKATDAGTYHPTATLKDASNTKWADGAATTRTLTWTIAKRTVKKPEATATAWTYTGNVQTGFVENVALYAFDEQNRQTNAGTFTPTATLVDAANTEWEDAGYKAAPSRSDFTWTIGPQLVTKPTARTGLVFTGAEQTAVDEETLASTAFTLSGHTATDAGAYAFTARLNNDAGPNYQWKNGNYDDLVVDWSIAKKTVDLPQPAGTTPTYTYDGTEKEPFPESDWYAICEGVGKATAADDYVCKIRLNYNSATVTNVTWTGGSAAEMSWDWKITAKKIAPPAATTFSYDESPKGIAVVRTMLTIPADAEYRLDTALSDELEQSQAGTYAYTLELNDPDNTVWTSGETAPQEVVCKIVKAENEIVGLTMKDWQTGAAESAPSVTSVKFGSVAKVVYTYSDSSEGPWATAKLTENGFHYVRAAVAEEANWNATESIKRYCVWTHPSEAFTDYADITVKGSGENLWVAVRLSEPVLDSTGAVTGGLPGFEYARTGTRGSEMCFLWSGDDAASKIDDSLLAWTNRVWNTSGESTLWVQVPKVTASGATVRLYWHAKAGATISTGDTTQSPKSVDSATVSFDALVNREGTFVNYWTTKPSITKTQWDPETEKITEDDIRSGTLKSGSVTNWFVTMPSEAVTNSTLQTASGTYRVFFDMARPETGSYTVYGGLVSLEYAIVGHTWFYQIGDTADGRILLGNNDSMEEHEVTGQAYWQTEVTSENSTFWTHTETVTVPSGFPYLGEGVEHTLCRAMGGNLTNRLWHLADVRLGNIYYAEKEISSRNYLSWTSTSSARTKGAAISAKEVTHIIIRNVKDAAIYSPCYTNGIGAVYFDAVNAFINDTDAKVVVEVATKTGQGLPPTDENCQHDGDPYYYLTHDDQGALPEGADMWEPIRPTVLIKERDATEFVEDTTQKFENETVNFAITTGKSRNAFYRTIALCSYRGPIRFRIRRPEKSSSSASLDEGGLILLDNILVSPPAMSANLDAVGEYDKDQVGKQVLGQACAFDKPFPGRTDTGLHGRAKISYVTTPGIAYDTSKFVASARLNYRWRYLNQSFEPVKLNGVDQWKTVYLDHTALGDDGVMTAVRPLEFPSAVGDIEWFYDMTLQAPTYKFVDYSGLTFEKPTGDFTEELRSVTNHVAVAAGDRLASCGTNWFLRLREGKSDWQKMQVVIESEETTAGKLVGTFDMELVDDNMWRAFVLVPTNSEGTCTFSFRGRNFQTGSPTGIVENAKSYGLSAPGQEANIPANGTLTEGGYPVQFTIDHAAGYLEFKMSDRYLTFQVGRAEYQDFNLWNDANSEGDRFFVDSTDTNSVNIADMTITNAPTGTWPLFVSTDHSGWDEAFEVADYAATDGRFVKNVFHQERHETPNSAAWAAQNITFVSEKFVKNESAVQKTSSGMAGKLLGSGSGLMDFSSSSAPEGIERIDLTARIGQSDTFDSFAFCSGAYSYDNYTFFAPVTMSHNTKADGSESGDMAVGASVSLVGYHCDKVGCYEVRCERLFSENQVRLSLWKWTYSDQKYVSQRLAYRDFEEAICWSQEKTSTGTKPEKDRTFYGLFISFETVYEDEETCDRPKQTRIVCGLSNGNTTSITDPWKYYSYSATDTANKRNDIEWNGLTYTDASDPHGWGRYGATSKECPAQFVMPAHQLKPFDGTISEEKDNGEQGGKYFTKEPLAFDKVPDVFEFVDDRYELHKKRIWATNPGRCECFTNTAVSKKWIGLHAPTNVTQTLELYLKKRNTDESQWTLASTPIAVSEYGFVQKSFDLKVTGQWDVRLRTGASKAIDVVVDNITQYKWQADDLPDDRAVLSAFYYSQCVIRTNEAAKTNYVRLQPARAQATRPLAVRSPAMAGLGKLTFTYTSTDLDKNAEIWVQVATNAVNTGSRRSYDESVKSVEMGEQQTVGTWLTVKKFKATGAEDDDRDLTKSTQKSVYLGWHNHPDRPLKGLWRLFVPTNVVKAANVAATNATQNVDYGAITITDVICTDEPGFSDRSWRGWNMRTVGDPADSEKRMNLVDMKTESGVGQVCALNNSISDVYYKGKLVEAGQEIYERLCQSYPAIYSPLMRPLNRRSGVGSVSFKARLYSTTGEPETTGGGQVWIYGSKDPTETGEDDWTFLSSFTVTGSVFSNYTWSAGNELYTAIKVEIHDPSAKTKAPGVDRIVLDEIVLGEKVPPTINFEYARPFRNNLFTEEPIADILSPAEQPLSGESWGVQTKLSLQQLTDEIDLEKGFEVYFMHQRGSSPWGYGNWEGTIASNRLVQVGDASNLVFRSVGDRPESLVEPATAGGEVVQFMLAVKYYDRGGKSDWITMDSSWQQPDWFYPLDYNEENGGYDEEKNFAAYTVLDTVSPGRAWINEVNWNDGDRYVAGKFSTTNQYIEICIPSGVDMTDWTLRFTDLDHNRNIFARFGDSMRGIPSSKVSAHAKNGYEFFVLQSPKTRDAGGIRYPGESASAADGTWYETPLGSIKTGTLDWGAPYQFELIRPSGIIEHQVVLDGTNTLSGVGSWAAIYDATNLVAELNALDNSPIRIYGGHDVDYKANRRAYASVGVTGGGNGSDRVADWPGGSNTWTEAMGFTPGRLNEGQTIPKDWFIAPNGTNSWVYFLLETGSIAQQVGSQTSLSILAVVPQGQKTNVVYTVANWYEAAVEVDGEIRTSGRTGTFPFELAPTGTAVYVTASAAPQSQLSERFGLDDGNAYTPAVLRWLQTKYPDASAEDIRLARFKGLQNWDDESWLTLTDMYWLDIPPVPVTDEEKATNDGTNWWFRGGITKMGVDHRIQRTRGGREVTYTNKQVDVTMYVSNACTLAKWAPNRLQGLGNEASDTFGGVWTSVTFKVKGKLDLSSATEFMPFRVFTFAADSFSGAEGDATMDPALPPFTSRIDILDPFQSPIGRNYYWDLYPNTKAYFIWTIDTKVYPYSTETLKADSTYSDETP